MTTILALDTTTTNCSAALLYKNEIIQELSVEPRVHNEKILHMVSSLVAKAGISLAKLDYIALSIGPGSFTGVRLGVSIAQGLAMGLGIKVIPLSSLHAVACHLSQNIDDGKIVVAFDARMQQIYASSYDYKGGVLSPATPDALLNPQDLEIGQHFYATGDGFTQYKDRFNENLNYSYIALEPNSNPQAKYVAMLGSSMADLAISPLELEPVYLRNNVAQKA